MSSYQRGSAGGNIINKGNSCVNQGEGCGVHTRTIVPSVGLKWTMHDIMFKNLQLKITCRTSTKMSIWDLGKRPTLIVASKVCFRC